MTKYINNGQLCEIQHYDSTIDGSKVIVVGIAALHPMDYLYIVKYADNRKHIIIDHMTNDIKKYEYDAFCIHGPFLKEIKK
jgi:hypothetical protein